MAGVRHAETLDGGAHCSHTDWTSLSAHTLDGGAKGDGIGFDGTTLVGVSERFNVKVFGAKGDGTTNDDSAVQAAITALTAAGGGILYFPPGTYLMATQHDDAGISGYAIGIPSNCLVLGAGRVATEIKCGVADTNLFYARSKTDLSIANLRTNGAGVSNNADGYKFLSCSRVNIYDTEASAARIGYQLLGCTDVSLALCHARNQVRDAALDDARGFSIGDMVGYTGTSRIQLLNCRAVQSADHGFAIFTNATDVQLSNCHALSCAGSGFRISDSLAQIINGFARANNIGFDIITSSGSRIAGHAIGNSQYGLRVLGTQRAHFDMTCRDNSVQTANTYSGVYVDDSGATFSTFNVFRLISGNTGTTGQKYGYEEAGSSGQNKVEGSLQNNQTGPGVFAATDIKRNILGYMTENGGTGAIASGATSVAITHGLSVTPAAKDVTITPTNAPSNAPGHIYCDTFTSTQFTVHCSVDPGVSTLTFSWHAAVL